MHPARPQIPFRPCPSCGQNVDPLRAARVLYLDDGERYFCTDRCKARFLEGDHDFDVPVFRPSERPRLERPSIPDLVREATLVRDHNDTGDGEGEEGRPYDPVIATGLALLGLILISLTRSAGTPWITAFLVVLCAAVNARIPLTTMRATPSLRVVASVGLVLAVTAGMLSTDPEARRWSLLGAAIAAIAVSIRSGLHSSMIMSLRTTARELLETLPAKARIPSQYASAYEEVSTADVRQGELVVLLEGEHAPADGVIEAGSGLALRYPKATHSRTYSEGDFVLAGTRLLEGAVTIRVRRTGRQRGVVRAIELGQRPQSDRALTSQLRFGLTQWSWLILAPATLSTLFWAGPAGASTLLLGLPLLALLASLDVPLHAGALASARRGMFFGSSRALRDAGRTKTAAILLRGALTTGAPMVQRVHSLGSMEISRVLALAAAAEQAAEDHPIARAIRQYASENDERTATVRKEREHTGLGVTAFTSHGVPIVVGRRQLLLNEGISVATADDDAAHIENEGLTPVFVAVDGRLQALLAILDPIHVGARDAIQRIADLPCEVVILSGDERRTVERIAAQLGAQGVKAPLLPQERVMEVRALRESGSITATIGRGGADDAVLAAADIPISLRLVGSDLEDRGIVVASQDVRDAAGALWVARAVRRATWRSCGACIFVAVAVTAGAVFGWMTPVVAALLALATEAWTLRAGSRLLHRVDMRVPRQQ
ncbi:MAG: HAD family hydrolase [Polyangiales bacterium]